LSPFFPPKTASGTGRSREHSITRGSQRNGEHATPCRSNSPRGVAVARCQTTSVGVNLDDYHQRHPPASPLAINRPWPEAMPPRAIDRYTPFSVPNEMHFIAGHAENIVHDLITMRATAHISHFGAINIVVNHTMQLLQRNRPATIITCDLQAYQAGAIPRILMRQLRGERRIVGIEACEAPVRRELFFPASIRRSRGRNLHTRFAGRISHVEVIGTSFELSTPNTFHRKNFHTRTAKRMPCRTCAESICPANRKIIYRNHTPPPGYFMEPWRPRRGSLVNRSPFDRLRARAGRGAGSLRLQQTECCGLSF
jgi:hypothetical protein